MDDEEFSPEVVFTKLQQVQQEAISSKVKVGALVVGINKEGTRRFFTGANIHVSDSFADIHAEQLAVNLCLLERCYPLAVHVTSQSKDEKVSLCGSCRHYLSEINKDMQIAVYNPDGSVKHVRMLSQIYPEGKNDIAKNQRFQILCLEKTISD